MNDNHPATDPDTILTMLAIKAHSQVLHEIARLTGERTAYEAAGIECRLIDRRLRESKEIERCSRIELIRCPARSIQEVAAKAVHLRRALSLTN